MSEVGAMIISLQAETAKFREDMGKVKSDIDEIKNGAGGMGSAMDNSMAHATGSVMLLEESLGVRLPRHLNRLIAEIPGVGMAFSTMLPLVGVVAAIAIIGKLVDKHKDAAKELNTAWKAVGEDGEKAMAALAIKALEVQKVTDELTGNHVKVLRDELALIDRQTLAEIEKQFEELGKKADEAFTKMQVGWFRANILQQGEGVKNVKERFDILLEAVRKYQDASNDKGVLHVLNEEHDKVKDIISTFEKWGTGDKNILNANKQELAVLDQMLERYKQIDETGGKEKKNATTKENLKTLAEQASLQKIITEGTDAHAAAVRKLRDTGAEASEAESKSSVDPDAKRDAALKAASEEFDAAVAAADGVLASKKKNYDAELKAAAENEAKKKELAQQFANDQRAHDDAVQQAASESYKKDVAAIAAAEKEKIALAEESARKLVELARKRGESDLEVARSTAENQSTIDKAIAAQKIASVKNQESLGLISKKDAILKEIALDKGALETKKADIAAAAAAQIAAYQKEIDAARAAAAVQQTAGVQNGDPRYIDYLQQVDILQTKIATTSKKAGAEQTAAAIQANTAIKSLQTSLQGLNSSWATYFAKMKTETQDLSTQIRTTLQGSINQFTKSFGDSMAKCIVEHKNLGQAVKQEAGQMLEAMISMLVQWLEKWIITHTLAAIFGKTSDDTQQESAASLAGANMVASWSAAPWPIDAMAPEMGMEAFAAAMAFADGGLVPGSGHGDTVPAMLSPGETVVSAALTQQVRENTGGGSRGDTHNHLHYAPHVSAIDADGVEGMLKKHATTFQRHVNATLRKQNKRN